MVEANRGKRHQIFVSSTYADLQEGTVNFTFGSATLQVRVGQVIVVPANTPHAFINSGDQHLQQQIFI